MDINVKVITPLKQFVIVPYIKGGVWDGELWLTLSVVEFVLNGKKYSIPAGFITDFGSIPRAARMTIDRMGKAAIGFVIHDWLREEDEAAQPVSTKVADLALYEIGLQYGETWWCMNKVYYSLRSFGWTADVGENEYGKVDIEVIKYICHSNRLKLETSI